MSKNYIAAALIIAAIIAASASLPSSAALQDVRDSLRTTLVSDKEASANAAPADAGLSGVIMPGLDDVKVRSSKWGQVIGTIPSGKLVRITETDGDWCVIDFNGRKGYILKYAMKTNMDFKSDVKSAKMEGVVDVNPAYGLNVRDGAWGDKIGKLGDGDKIDIIGEDGDWYKIRYKGKTGFVYKAYVKAKKSGSASPQESAGPDGSSAAEKPAEKPKPAADGENASDDGDSAEKEPPAAVKGSKGFHSNGLLAVPERAQRAPENGSIGSSLCGPTSLAMALEFYGINKPTRKVAVETKTLSSGGAWQGTCCENIAAAARKNLPGSYLKSNMSIDDLKRITASGKPIVVNVDTQGYWSKGHYMVVTGVKDGKVYVNDPWQGGQRTYSFSSFKAQWATRSYRGVVIQP